MAIFKVVHKGDREKILLACQHRGLNSSELNELRGVVVHKTTGNGNYVLKTIAYEKEHLIDPGQWLIVSQDREKFLILDGNRIGDYIFLGELGFDRSLPEVASCEELPTLRDQFAMAAVQIFLVSSVDGYAEKTATAAYEMADAMLKERNKPIPDPVEQLEQSEFGENVKPGGE